MQKSFLDQLHSEMDVNAAAAKALLHLKAKASLEASLEIETSEGAEGSPTASWWDSESSPTEQNGQHVKICDDEERTFLRDGGNAAHPTLFFHSISLLVWWSPG